MSEVLKKDMDMAPEYLAENEDVIRRSTPYIKQGHDPDRYLNLVDFAKPYKKILSVGCSGFEPMTYNAAFALDVSPVAGRLLKENGFTGLFVVGSCTNLPFMDQTFDCAICSEVIEHLPSDEDVLRTFLEISRVARDWLITTPASAIPEPTHKRLLDEACVKKLCAQFDAKYVRVNLWWFIWKSPVFWKPLEIKGTSGPAAWPPLAPIRRRRHAS
jgi:hypothetical protein